MKLACLLSVGGGITPPRPKGNPFRRAEAGPLPFLISTKRVNLAAVRVALNDVAIQAQVAQPAGSVNQVEAVILKSVVALFVLALLASCIGVQHIAYAKAKNQLGRQLRQKECELRAVTEAYRSLESETALQAVQGGFPQTSPHLTGVDFVRAPKVTRLTSGREGKSAPSGLGACGPGIKHSHVADARSPARRGGIRG